MDNLYYSGKRDAYAECASFLTGMVLGLEATADEYVLIVLRKMAEEFEERRDNAELKEVQL